MALPHFVQSVRLFGSTARKDNDLASDVDVLVIVHDDTVVGPTIAHDKVISRHIGSAIESSWYSARRFEEMHRQGHLFAWHIFNESVLLATRSEVDLVGRLGIPSPYLNAADDIAAFSKVVGDISVSIEQCPGNSVYEAGLAFLCARNIALAGSWFTAQGLNFSRWSPYAIELITDIKFPLDKYDYDRFAQCRHASQRGRKPPKITSAEVSTASRSLLQWAKEVYEFAKEKQNE